MRGHGQPQRDEETQHQCKRARDPDRPAGRRRRRLVPWAAAEASERLAKHALPRPVASVSHAATSATSSTPAMLCSEGSERPHRMTSMPNFILTRVSTIWFIKWQRNRHARFEWKAAHRAAIIKILRHDMPYSAMPGLDDCRAACEHVVDIVRMIERIAGGRPMSGKTISPD